MNTLISKPTIAIVFGFSKTKFDNTTVDSELEEEGYSLIRFDQSRRGGGVTSFVNQKPDFCINTGNTLVEIFLPKFKSALFGTLYSLPGKYNLVTCLEHTLSETTMNIYLLMDQNSDSKRNP